ncbi:MAG TPA: hypothetical protein VJ385_04510 [Fibrobacteria bacterium]|nr:hypothetical protein [Fibrobacteria bacterium]
MKSVKLGFFFLVILLVKHAAAQQIIFKPPRPTNIWKADTLYIGASFTRNSFDPVSVWLIGNQAGWVGSLYFIVPKTNEEVFLFTNKGTTNVRNVLSDKYDIPVGDTVYFLYKVTQPAKDNNPSEASRLPKYTGPNIPGESKFVTQPASAAYGHRWSVAGRVNDSIVQFGFEDNVNPAGDTHPSDMDFDDIVFGTTLSLASEEVQPHISFTDKAGNILAPGAFYSPENDTIYVTYTDDYVRANLSKDIVFNVRNRNDLAAADLDTFSVVSVSHNGAVGTWKLKVPIQEKPGIPGDKLLQSFFLGEVTATVKTHNRLGAPDNNSVSANLKVAYPDKPETVTILNCADSAADIVRTTNCIRIKAGDQSFTRGQDTVWAEVKCDGSGDIIGKVPLIEQTGGGYVSGNIVKNETNPPVSDQILSCKSSDNVTVTYVDEVYNNRVTDKKTFSGNAAEGFTYVETAAPGTVITQITDGAAPTFTAVVKAPTPTVDVVDQINVVMTSSQGDIETFKATETGPNTGVFTVDIPYGFQTIPVVSGSGKVDGFLDPTQTVTGVAVTGVATVNNKEYTAAITLKPALNAVKNAYIKDVDGDGRGDKVYIVFSRPLEALPATLTPTYWNVGGDPNFDNAAPPVLSLLDGALNTLVADFSAAPFPKGATSIPATAQKPYATLPGDPIFGGQKPVIADSMGPIIVAAVIKPFNNLTVVAGSTELNVDTLRITLSESIKTQGGMQGLLRFSKTVNGACTDYAHSVPVVPNAEPTINPDGSYTFLIAAGKGPSPLAGDCVYVNVNGTYTDLFGNLPPEHGEPIQGPKPAREIELFRGYPPVAGMNPSSPGFVVVNNDPQSDLGSEYSTKSGAGYQTKWVPPADFPTGAYDAVKNPYVPVIPGAITAPVEPGKDAGTFSVMPPGISTVQVISTGEYIADVAIFDNLGNFVKSFKQAFGYRGELNNQERAAKRGLVSYLVWDLRNNSGQKAGQGVYVWKVVFRFKAGKQEIRYTRTGVMRN